MSLNHAEGKYIFTMESLSASKRDNIKSEMDFYDEPMDISETPLDSYYEDGEVKSSDEELEVSKNTAPPISSIFSRNTSRMEAVSSLLFNEEDNLKKLDRAKRFALPIKLNNTLNNYQEQLANLYRDLGIDKENERHYRFNAIHMRGTQNMSTEDVLKYFELYNPSLVEWVNDVSCNIIWSDDVSTARALLNLSKRIKNLDKVHLNADPFKKELTRENLSDEDENNDECFDARKITTAIPPGYWRIGEPTEKSPFLLLRYATRSDKKQRQAEKNSEYYKKYGNPHFGNVPGIFSKSLRNGLKKSKFKGHASTSLWQNDKPSNAIQSNDKNNPWEELAYEWGKTDKVEDEDYTYGVVNKTRSSNLNSDVTDLRISLSKKKKEKRKTPVSNRSSQDSWETKMKVPRMKMYADDEEEKRLEKSSEKSFQKSRATAKPVEDLRSKINRNKKKEGFDRMEERQHVETISGGSSGSENDYEDTSGTWALEDYQDLRQSLIQNKRHNHRRLKATRYESESDSESEVSGNNDGDFNLNMGQRSPLQIEIDNDEYYQNRSGNR